MKKRMQILGFLLTLGLVLAACGQKDTEQTVNQEQQGTEDTFNTEDEQVEGEAEVPEEEAEPEGMFRSEITNEWIEERLYGQRPVAIMVDNEKTALDHYGLTQADVVYELMNSTANGRITRFMCIVKDWQSITQFGSIRSVRPTNFMLAPEWNAILCHDGGPMYINAYLQNPYIENLSGGFARIKNGKPREFTEYITTGELEKRIASKGYSTQYNDYYQGNHYKFANENDPVDLVDAAGVIDCTFVDLPFAHNGSELSYDAASGLYLYSEYGKPHVDPANGNKQLSFKNLLIQDVYFEQYDAKGYMGFRASDSGRDGWYITNGKAIPVTWEKNGDLDITRYYDMEGNEITLNTGKTYVAFVPYDNWDELVLK